MSIENDDKRFKLILAAIRTSNYSLPIFLDLCKLYDIDPEDLKPKKIEDFFDKKTCSEIHELRFSHYESKRKSHLNFLCKEILQMNLNFLDLKTKSLSAINLSVTPSKNEVKNFLSILPQNTKTKLMNQSTPKSSPYDYQKKKLSKAIKHLSNVQSVRSEEEQKKIDFLISKKQKFDRIKQEKDSQLKSKQQKFPFSAEKREKNSTKSTDATNLNEKRSDPDSNDYSKMQTSRNKSIRDTDNIPDFKRYDE